MKRIIIISITALVALCACSKNEVNEAPSQEITFAVASYAGQTKANPADYAEEYGNIPFGTYAWFYQNGQKAQEFMVDETVSLDRKTQVVAWKPSITYYWPKSGTIDFISYSPKAISKYVTVTPESVKFGDAYTVEHLTDVDVMYADKAVGCSMNVDTYYYNGVPTLFRHALAKLNVKISTAYDAKVVKEGEDETKWAITVTDITLKDYFNTGSAALALANDNSWTLPEGSVWKNDGKKTSQKFDLPTDATISTTAKDFISDYFVLPQNLNAGQTLEITVDIVTTLPNGLQIVEKNVKLSAVLGDAAVKAWQMNKQISYNIVFTPAAGKPGDPDGQIAITFDPAVEDWENAASSALEIL